MLIAWVQKTTLVDYPDKIASIIFTPWCNLRCRFCHNPELVIPQSIQVIEKIPEENFFAFLDTRIWLIDAVVISGWEPTLQRDLPDFCRKIKEKWFAVKLDTNWRDPEIVRQLIDQHLIDYVAMDIKIDQPQRLQLLQSKEKSHPYLATIQLLLNSSIEYEFRTTLIKPYHNLYSFTAMLQLIPNAKRYYLQIYRPQLTLDTTFDGNPFSYAEMHAFQLLAKEYVQECYLR